MYIYHFWPLCMHCKRRLRFDVFGATYDLLVVLRKPWICTLCFDAHFSKFRDFWWFWTILIEKWTFWTTFGTSDSLHPKVTIYLPLSPWTLSKPVKTLSKPYFLTTLDPFWGSGERVADIRPNKMALFDLVRNDTKWCKYVKTCS